VKLLNSKKMDYKEVVSDVNGLLASQKEWEERYAAYAKSLSVNENDYRDSRKKFQVNSPLYVYTNITQAKGTCEYDLRFAGQSVATIKVVRGKVFISTKNKDKSNKKFFEFTTPLHNTDWNSPDANKFRKHFKNCEKNGKSPEHQVENRLLAEFRKKLRADDKKLCNIQPVTLFGQFFQMPTPFTASGTEIKYSKEKGGGIDILSRIKHLDNKPNLCVMELKDENKAAESPAKVMKQAVAYATFIAQLLRSKSGNEWYRLFGFNSNVPENLTIDVAIVMPADTIRNEKFGEELEVCSNTTLKLYSLYFEKDSYDFTGSLKDNLLK
jgi:hypothetical protein